MFDLGLGSLSTLSLKDLAIVLLALVAWTIAVLVIGFDRILITFVAANTFAILLELGRRAWVRLRTTREPPAPPES